MLNRRFFVLGAASLPGCTALASLNQAAEARDVYDLRPVTVDVPGGRSARSLMVLEPTAAAAINSDNILIRPSPLAVAYLPAVRWSDDVPLLVQSLLVKSLAGTGRIGFVGPQGAGPVPDMVLITRIDRFGADIRADGVIETGVTIDATVLRDRDQRVMGTRMFGAATMMSSDLAPDIVQGIQSAIDAILPELVPWVISRVAGS